MIVSYDAYQQLLFKMYHIISYHIKYIYAYIICILVLFCFILKVKKQKRVHLDTSFLFLLKENILYKNEIYIYLYKIQEYF